MQIKNIYIRYGLWAIVMIFLGAIGNAFGDMFLSPLFAALTRLFLFVYTFGSVALKNMMYVEIAKGFHESYSLRLLYYFMSMVVGLILSTLIVFLYRFIQRQVHPKQAPRPSSRFLIIRFVFPLYSIFAVSFIIISLFADLYVNRAITYFNQSLTICSPYISSSDMVKINSRFAQIQDRQAYVDIVEELKLIASSNNLTLPNFEIW